MRKFMIAGVALLAASPLMAQPQAGPYPYEDEWQPGPAPQAEYDPRGDFEAAPAPYGDPRGAYGVDVGRMGVAMERMVGAIMDLPVGGIAAAVDPLGRGGIHPRDTVRDLARRDDPYAEQRIRSGIRGAARGADAMGVAVARMMPVLQQSIAEVSASFAAAIGEVDRGDDY